MSQKIIKIELYQEMSNLTFDRCKKSCHKLGSCCEEMYCEIAEEMTMQMEGVVLSEIYQKNKNNMYLNEHGGCVVPPHLRKLCTVHLCGDNMKDQAYDNLYEKIQYAEMNEE